MTQVNDRRCQHYHSIDFDFYRAQAVALRSQARRDAFKFYPAFRLALVTLATTLTITVVSSMQFQWA